MPNHRQLSERAVTEYKAVQLAEELAALSGLLPPLHRVLEIGVRAGGTLWLWSQLAEDEAQLMGVDIDIEQITAPLSNTILYHGDSRSTETLQAVQDRFDGPLDFLFIDGDHTVESVQSDWNLYSPFVRSDGGIIAFHDIGVDAPVESGPFHVWTDLRQRHAGLMIQADRPGWEYRLGIGVIFKGGVV